MAEEGSSGIEQGGSLGKSLEKPENQIGAVQGKPESGLEPSDILSPSQKPDITEIKRLTDELDSIIKQSGTSSSSIEEGNASLEHPVPVSKIKEKIRGINFRKWFGRRERVRIDDLWDSLTNAEGIALSNSILGNALEVRDADQHFVSILQKSIQVRTDSDLRLNAARLVGEGVSEESVIEVMERGTLASDEAIDEVFKTYVGNYAEARRLFTTDNIEGLWIVKSVLDTAYDLKNRGIPRQTIYAILKKANSWKLFVGLSKLSDGELRVIFPEIKTAINLNVLEDFRNPRLLYLIEESLGKENPALEEVLENLGITGPIKNIDVELLDNGGEYKSVFKVTVTPEAGNKKTLVLKIYKSRMVHSIEKSKAIYEDVQEFQTIKSLESTGAVQKIYTKEPVFIDYKGRRQMLVFEEFIDGEFMERFKEADMGTRKEIAFAYGENVIKIWKGTKRTVKDMEEGAIPEDNFLHNTFLVREDGRWVAKTFDFTTVFTGYGKLQDAVVWGMEAIIANFTGENTVTKALTLPGDPTVIESYLSGVTSQLGEDRNEFLQRLLSTVEKGRGSDYPPLEHIRKAVEKLANSPH